MTNLTAASLSRGQDNLDALERQINQKTMTTTNSDGEVVQTITGALTNFGYEPPVVFSDNAVIERVQQTVKYNDNVFAPKPELLPFTTTSIFDDSQWYLVVGNQSNKNYLINGDFRINQRGRASGSVSSLGLDTYTADRWFFRPTTNSGATTHTYNMVARSVQGLGFAQFEVAGCTSNTYLAQRIEFLPQNGQRYMFSCLFTSTVEVTCRVLMTCVQNGSIAFQTQSNITIPADLEQLVELQMQPVTGMASTLPTVNDYTEIQIIPLSGSVTPDGTFTIKRTKFELGTIATPFEYRPIAEELALCQRYFQILDYGTAGNDCANVGYAHFSTYNGSRIKIPKMRTAPSISYEADGTSNSTNVNIGISGSSSVYSLSQPMSFKDITDSGFNLAGFISNGPSPTYASAFMRNTNDLIITLDAEL
tara:strand:- start:494 stop:1756 length:1263 start_codon:yes stop_codon:yes gene_type:complete